jgi:hypothetical protein
MSHLSHELGDHLSYCTAKDLANIKQRLPGLQPHRFDRNDLQSLAKRVEVESNAPFNNIFLFEPPVDASGKGFMLGISTYP